MRKNIVIVIENEEKDALTKALIDLGLVISSTYDFGVIIGSIEEDKIESIKLLKGVISVTFEKIVTINNN